MSQPVKLLPTPPTHPPTHPYQEKNKALISTASSPIVTSQAIHHALTSAYPHTRYMVGNVGGTPAAVLGWGIWLLNDRLLDRVITPVYRKGAGQVEETKEEV